MGHDQQGVKTLTTVTAAVTATAAAGLYAYDQYSKRYPRYQEQQALFSQVSPPLTSIHRAR